MNNIADPSIVHSCTSCQMCAAVCSKGAITIRLDSDGFYRPYIEDSLCVDCGLCKKVCYKYDEEVEQTSLLELDNMPLYAASVRDKALLNAVTSGGIADILAKQLIQEGYQCIGVAYDNKENVAFHTVASNAKETDIFRGSKYIQSFSFPAFKELVQNCLHQRYAVFGTPCQIYSISRYLSFRKLREKFVLVDLYCHGCPSIYAWQKYIEEVKSIIQRPKIDAVSFRDKVKGRGNFYVVVVVVQGVKAFVSSPRKDEFYELFFSDQILNEACADCKLRSTMAYADIRLGDFWGKKYAMNIEGVSAVSLNTKRGRALFESILDKIEYQKHLYKDFLPYQSYGRIYQPNEVMRRKLLDSLSDRNLPLSSTIRILHKSHNPRQKAKRYIKYLFYYFPSKLIAVIKRLVS